MTRILALIPAVMMALLAFMIAHIVGEKVSIWAERVLVFIFVLIGAVAAFIVQERRCRRAEAEVARLNVAVSGLKRRIHQSETVVTHTANGVLAIDHNGRITLSNTALEKMFGQSESALLGRKIEQADLHPELARIAYECISSVTALQSEIRLPGWPVRVLAVRAVSVRGRTEDSDSVLFIIHDVSDIRRRQMREREFVGNVSHELRTPITAILTTAETLLAGAKNDPDVVDRFLGTIISESKRLSALIEDILEITKRDYGITKNNVAESAVSDVVNRAIDLVRPQAKNAGVEIIADLPDGLRVSWDDTQVVRLIGNLVDNAVKYSPGGGRVDVNSYEEGSMLVISVADKGMGIPHGEIDRIFDRFYRIDKAHSRRIGGTGLGLAIVKDIVNACDGSIAVETQLGVGTTFTVKLPMRGTLQEDSEECMADNPDCQA